MKAKWNDISDDENKYIIAMDHSFDNQVMREIIRLKKYVLNEKMYMN